MTRDELVAEYVIRDAYDRRRSLSGWDMGHGRRRRVINELVNELVRAGVRLGDLERGLTSAEPEALLAAWRRIGRPALRRLERQAGTVSARRYSTGPAISLAHWRAVEQAVGECVGQDRLGLVNENTPNPGGHQMTDTERVNKRGAGRLTGEDDDRGVMVRRYLDELRHESTVKGGLEGIIAALRGPDRGRYRAALRHTAAGILQYSGRGYPAAGVEPYGPAELDVAGVREDAYEQARRLIDELDVMAARRTVDEVLDAAVGIDELDGIDRDGIDRERVALEVSSRRRARR